MPARAGASDVGSPTIAYLARPEILPGPADLRRFALLGFCYGPLACGFLALGAQYTSGAHVSLLFSPQVVAESQRWVAQTLGIDSNVVIPPRLPLVGGVLGLVGIFLLAGPFVREALGKSSLAPPLAPKTTEARLQPYDSVAVRKQPISIAVILEYAGLAFVAVLLLLWNPFGFVHLFEGDYLAGFLLITGIGLLATQYKRIATLRDLNWKHLLGAAFAAVPRRCPRRGGPRRGGLPRRHNRR